MNSMVINKRRLTGYIEDPLEVALIVLDLVVEVLNLLHRILLHGGRTPLQEGPRQVLLELLDHLLEVLKILV